MFTKKTKKAGKKGGKPFGGKGAKPFAKKAAGGGVPSGGMPMGMDDESALDAKLGASFRTPAGKGLPTRPPWA